MLFNWDCAYMAAPRLRGVSANFCGCDVRLGVGLAVEDNEAARLSAMLWEENSSDGLRKDDAVKPNRPIADVPGFELHTIFKGELISPAHLPETGNPRTRGQDGKQIHAYAIALLREVGSRADQTHIAF